MHDMHKLSEQHVNPFEARRYLLEVMGDPELPFHNQPNSKALKQVFELYAGRAWAQRWPRPTTPRGGWSMPSRSTLTREARTQHGQPAGFSVVRRWRNTQAACLEQALAMAA